MRLRVQIAEGLQDDGPQEEGLAERIAGVFQRLRGRTRREAAEMADGTHPLRTILLRLVGRERPLEFVEGLGECPPRQQVEDLRVAGAEGRAHRLRLRLGEG